MSSVQRPFLRAFAYLCFVLSFSHCREWMYLEGCFNAGVCGAEEGVRCIGDYFV